MNTFAPQAHGWRPGTTVSVDLVPTTLGLALLAATSAGVCAVWLGDDDGKLLDTFGKRFEGAVRVPATPAQQRWFRDVRNTIDELGSMVDVPLDCFGTAFQQRVWAALRTIPRGSTRTYKELAGELGVPGALRAVGTACGANPVAILVPCHRVLRADGGLGGYRWGAERKVQLLARERA